jgi:polysaccharide pyruvyl transferase WcaK-like protein
MPDATRQGIALFGDFGTGNLGNEATLQAMVWNIRRRLPNAEISCICSAPENTALQYNISAVPIRAPLQFTLPPRSKKDDGSPNPGFSGFAWLRMPLRIFSYPLIEAYRWYKGLLALRRTQALIMTGTGMVGDFAITPFGLHYDIFRWAVIAKFYRCKLLFVSVGSGPIRHPLSRWFIRTALSLADYRSYRDVASKDHLAAIGLDVKNDSVYPDLAFSLPIGIKSVDHNADREVIIGVGLMNYHNRANRSGTDETIYRQYIQRMASFVVRLLECGYAIRILIGDLVWDQDVRQDFRTELQCRGLKLTEQKIVDEPAGSVDALLSQLSAVDIVVASRFHNVLLGMMLEKPVVAISYHEKFSSLMDGVGLRAFSQDIEHIDVEDLINKVIGIQQQALDIKARVAQQSESYRAALDEQYARIIEYLSGGRANKRFRSGDPLSVQGGLRGH